MSKKKKQEKTSEEDISVQEKSTGKEKSENKKEDELKSVKEALEQEKERNLRLFAEFENYKKRTSRERLELFKTASQDVMTSMLPVLDDFDRALKEISKSEDDVLFQGVELIHNKLKETLKNKGLEPIGTQVGDAFDSEIHEAVTQIPAPSDDMKGKIIDVIEKGYTLGEKIIRFPKVIIGN